ncbi:MAG: hypothetical protein ACE5OZ_10585 [Candidatus Heimdallarchaeota archaeon]
MVILFSVFWVVESLPQTPGSASSVGGNITTVDSPGEVGLHTSLALNATGYAHITYYDFTNGDLKYTYQNGLGWSTTLVDTTGNIGYYPSPWY